jgi:hypothetical protein
MPARTNRTTATMGTTTATAIVPLLPKPEPEVPSLDAESAAPVEVVAPDEPVWVPVAPMAVGVIAV